MNEGVMNEVHHRQAPTCWQGVDVVMARKQRGKVLDGEQQIFKQQLRLAPRWAPSSVQVLCKYFDILKSTPVLIGNLSARYLHTGDL